jgi:hypothetical protein
VIIMPCTRLCEDLGFGSRDYVKGAKHCLYCVLFIMTESGICACCGNTLGCYVDTPDYKKSKPSFAWRR